MALQDHAVVRVMLNGNPLENITRCTLSTDSGQLPVDVLRQGLAGFTPGAGSTKVDLGYTIPISGSEHDYQGDCAVGAYIKLQVGRADKDFIAVGKILTNEESQSTGSSLEGSISWQGPLKAMK